MFGRIEHCQYFGEAFNAPYNVRAMGALNFDVFCNCEACNAAAAKMEKLEIRLLGIIDNCNSTIGGDATDSCS